MWTNLSEMMYEYKTMWTVLKPGVKADINEMCINEYITKMKPMWREREREREKQEINRRRYVASREQ